MAVMTPPEKHELLRKRPANRRARTEYEAEWHRLMGASQAHNVVACIVSQSDTDHELQDIGLAESVMGRVCAVDSDDDVESWIREGVLTQISDVECHSEVKVQIGSTVYPFIRPLLMRHFQEEGVLLASPLIHHSLRIEGRGNNYTTCLRSYAEKFHLRFQELEALIPSEMSDIERREWTCLASFVDITEYRQETPFEFRRVGVVVSRDPFSVKWLDQESNDPIDLRTAPANLAALPEGTWLEAVVSYSRRDDRVIRILSVETTSPLVPAAGVEHAGLSDLPRDDWDSI